MAHLSRWLLGEHLDVHGLCAAKVDRFLNVRRAVGYKNHRTNKAMQPMLSYLRDLGAAPAPTISLSEGPVEELLERYRHYLSVERGLASSTVCGYVYMVRPFLSGRILPDGLDLDLEHLSTANVTTFVVNCCARLSNGTAKLTVTALRSLLRFLHVEGLIERSLVAAVPSIAGRRLAGLPKALESTQVHRLLTCCDRHTAIGRRDFAILTLLIRLGLRVGEVATLDLDDIDWRTGDFVVRGKGARSERLPLPTDVGEAVADYLQRGRPTNVKVHNVFLPVRAPHRALSADGVAQVVICAAKRAGLAHIHAHRLRHTAATQLLNAGASLPEIGQLLRHRRVLTTAIYAKVDRKSLRLIARTWPGGVA